VVFFLSKQTKKASSRDHDAIPSPEAIFI